MSQDVSFTAVIQIRNARPLRRYYISRELGPSDATIAALLPLVLLNPRLPPAQSGFEVLDSYVLSIERCDVYRLTVEVQVHDGQSLIDEAKDRHASCWFNENWEPQCLAQAAYEVLLASNANPTPQDLGFKLIGAHFQIAPCVA